MNKRNLKKLTLNRETIASLNHAEMSNNHGGGAPSKIGVSCYTGHCCYSKIECNLNDPLPVDPNP